MLIHDRDRILELLGSGLANGIVASTIGCDPAIITNLMAEEEFSSKVVELRSKSLLAATKRDRSIDEIEEDLIEILGEQVKTRQIYKPREVLQAFSVLNRAQRRGNPAEAGVTINNNIVQLVLPTSVTQGFTKNIQGEVIEVEGQSLQTMPAQSLLKHLASTKGDQSAEVYERIGRYIAPPALEHSVRETSE